MLEAAFKDKARMTRARRWASTALTLMAVGATLAACGSDSGSGDSAKTASTAAGSGAGEPQLIVATMGFPCSLNDFAKSLCAGFEAGKATLPPGSTLQVKTGTDYADQTAFNNLIQTSAQLDPGGLIVFPGGASAQVPVLKQACAKGIKIITIDGKIDGLGDCQSGFIGLDHEQMGRDIGQWLVDHPPANKTVGIVAFAPGQASGIDDRVAGFKEVVEPAGFKVEATVVTDLAVDKTRTLVTDMLTAHPDLGAILSTNDQMGYGTAQAVKHTKSKVMQLSIDGALDAVKRIVDGDLAADVASDPSFMGSESARQMAQLLSGKKIPAETHSPLFVVDKDSAERYLALKGKVSTLLEERR